MSHMVLLSLSLTTFPLWMVFAAFPKCNSTISNNTKSHTLSLSHRLSLFPLHMLKSIFVTAPYTSHVKSSTHPLTDSFLMGQWRQRRVTLKSSSPSSFSLSSSIKSSIERACLFTRCPWTHVTLCSLICGSHNKKFLVKALFIGV